MRQVMPHRSNIGADRFSCKSFLHGMSTYPLNSGDCGIPVRIPPPGGLGRISMQYQ